MCEQKTEVKKVVNIINVILFVLFIISLVPYLILPYFSIKGVSILWSENDYGFEAWLFSFIILSIYIPIFPLTIPYQFIFMVFPFRKLSRALKKASVIAIIVTLIITLLPPTVIDILEYNKSQAKYYHDKATIEEYLTDEFGKENFENMKIILSNDADSTKYKVVSPMLKQRFTVTIDDDEISDDFDTLFTKQYDLHAKLVKKLTQECNFPNDISISIRNMNITDYSNVENIDRILDSCQYQLDYVTFHLAKYDKNNVVERIKDFFEVYGEKLNLSKDYDKNWPNFLVRLNGEKYANIHMHIVESRNETHLRIGGYNNGNGWTLMTEDIIITFN